MMLTRLTFATIALLSLFTAHAEDLSPVPILAEQLKWQSPPHIPGLQAAWMLGSETGHDAYVLRVKLAAGSRIPPHTHPDARITTVLSGQIAIGFGSQIDESRMVTVPAGAVYLVPANIPHYLWAKEGEVLYQESGAGPTATAILKTH